MPGGDRLQNLIESIKRLVESPEKLIALSEKKLQEHYLRDWIKNSLPPAIEGDEKRKDFCKSLETLPLKGLKKIYEEMLKGTPVSKELGKEILNFLFLIKIEGKASYPPTLFKNFRRTAWQLIYLEKVMKYAFFIGMFSILIFSIINLLR